MDRTRPANTPPASTKHILTPRWYQNSGEPGSEPGCPVLCLTNCFPSTSFAYTIRRKHIRVKISDFMLRVWRKLQNTADKYFREGPYVTRICMAWISWENYDHVRLLVLIDFVQPVISSDTNEGVGATRRRRGGLNAAQRRWDYQFLSCIACQ